VLSFPAEFVVGSDAGAAAEGGNPDRPRLTQPAGGPNAAVALVGSDTNDEPEEAPGGAPPANPVVNEFMMGLDDAFRQLLEAGPPSGVAPVPPPTGPTPDAVEGVFLNWLPDRNAPKGLDPWQTKSDTRAPKPTPPSEASRPETPGPCTKNDTLPALD